MKLYKKAILPKGFLASGIACGIKRKKLDLGLIFSQKKSMAKCMFTVNKIQAAPIIVNKKHLKASREFQAIIVNSGNANCFNGQAGIKDAKETALSLAKLLKLRQRNILLASTGIIGKRIPLNKIKAGLPELIQRLSRAGINTLKKAIMTTDTFPKEATAVFNIGNKKINICGIAKGAGMIAPDLATMLVFIFSDVKISQMALNKALKQAVENSFNCISVDGCMSTNDSVMMLANAAAGNAIVDTNKNYALFAKSLHAVCLELARLIIKDAEGATKFLRIKIKGAQNFNQAKRAALGIANSNLFKTAMYGESHNFGRIVAALGSSGIAVSEKDIKIKVGALNKKEINIEVEVNKGNSSCTVYTSDLTPEYIKINAEYN
ncbi:MAG: ornithine acetyltransferase [Candidatus Omnitrophota bacterium]|nr:MAG: ornithine acetyltransferase [Candidatus Omnitrophota bacterium]